jgi:hypothetical protein
MLFGGNIPLEWGADFQAHLAVIPTLKAGVFAVWRSLLTREASTSKMLLLKFLVHPGDEGVDGLLPAEEIGDQVVGGHGAGFF